MTSSTFGGAVLKPLECRHRRRYAVECQTILRNADGSCRCTPIAPDECASSTRRESADEPDGAGPCPCLSSLCSKEVFAMRPIDEEVRLRPCKSLLRLP